jgi:hypothetical protein
MMNAGMRCFNAALGAGAALAQLSRNCAKCLLNTNE